MNRKLRTLMASLLAGSMLIASAQAATFSDVDADADYAEAAEYLNEIGVMQGDSAGCFNPNKNVTRAQMAALICRMLGETENLSTDGTRFSDVAESYWANKYIIKAASLKIIGGYQDDTFKPDNTVTYEQALAMVVRAMGEMDEADAAGGYPDGILKVAEQNGYTNQLLAQKGDVLARWQVAMILYNVVV